jgi:hypothetical protein
VGGGGAGASAGGFSTGGVTGGVTTGGVVAPGSGSATFPLIIVVLSTLPCCAVWEGCCSAARASLAARTKATRHKTSAAAIATVFRLVGSTRLVVLLANQRDKPLALPISSVATRPPRRVRVLHKSSQDYFGS